MSQIIAVKLPDIGGFKDVAIIEVLVKAGDTVSAEQSLITLETDKATMEVPSPSAGKITEMKVKLGDKVSEGSVILMLETSAAPVPVSPAAPKAATSPAPQAAPTPPARIAQGDIHAEVVVLGAGPGG
jgi:dihydrolipoamide dehydrogenase